MDFLNSTRKSQIIFKELLISNEDDVIYSKYYRVLKRYKDVLSDPSMKVLFSAFVTFNDRLGCKPIPSTLKDFIETNDIPGFNEKIKKTACRDLKYLVESIFTEHETKYVINNLEIIIEGKIKADIQAGIKSGDKLSDLSKVIELAKSMYCNDILNQEHLIEEVDPFDLESYKSIIKYKPEKISIDFSRRLTNFLHGGFVLPSFTIFAGGAKMGKTHLMMAWIKDLVLQGKNVLLVVTEQNKEAFCNRILYPCFIPDFNPDLADNTDYIKYCEDLFNEFNKLYGVFRFIIAPIGTLGFDKIDTILREGTTKGKYHYAIFDMLFHLRSNFYKSGDNKVVYDDIVFNIIKLKNIHSINIIGTCHAATDQATKVRQDTEGVILYDPDKLIAERKTAVTVADYVIGLHRCNTEALASMCRVAVLLDRWSGCDGDVVYYQYEMDNSRFWEISFEDQRRIFDGGESAMLSQHRLDPKGYYERLGLFVSATQEDIIESWEWVEEEYSNKEKDKMYSVKRKAFEVLSNPQLKREYDLN